MLGAVRKGYGNSTDVVPEYNVKADAPACQTVFTAPWEMTITLLDTSGTIVLRGEKFAKVRDSDDPMNRALIENYSLWAENAKWFAERKDKKECAEQHAFRYGGCLFGDPQ